MMSSVGGPLGAFFVPYTDQTWREAKDGVCLHGGDLASQEALWQGQDGGVAETHILQTHTSQKHAAHVRVTFIPCSILQYDVVQMPSFVRGAAVGQVRGIVDGTLCSSVCSVAATQGPCYSDVALPW